ncbi:MAG TPA: DUF3450 domain-containing protein [Solimonas sp.]|jgi:chromosome segregation ATPase|nr:DUF3450 domain-containing protein [Solimonas sp.]
MSNSALRAAVAKHGGWASAVLLLSSVALANPATVNKTISEQSATEQSAQQTQQKVNQLDDETRSAVAEYRSVISETESLKRYNEQLALTVKSQLDEMELMQKQLGEVETTAREIVPLLAKMLETLDQFVKLDTPFLPEERANRVNGLKDVMTRADVTIAEKYRRILEAYQVEMEYGRTIETYQGKVGEKTVDFLRVGRVALLYQTLDGGETGYWDAEKKAWQEDGSYKASVQHGLKIAKKQVAPDLLVVPVAAPKGGK